MWSDLSVPWRAAVEMAWEAYCADTVPIGAVITSPKGEVIIRERNRIEEKNQVLGKVTNHQLAHAELNALLQFDSFAEDRNHYSLYTTMEPCPLCLGAIYMSGLRTVHYGARDLFAGCTDLLGKNWYMSRKPVRAFAPTDALMESVSIVLNVESELRTFGIKDLEGVVLRRWSFAFSREIDLGVELYNKNELQKMREGGFPALEMFDRIAAKVKW